MGRKVHTSRRGYVEYLRVQLKGMNPSKARCMEIGRVRELYPHLMFASNQTFGGTKSSSGENDIGGSLKYFGIHFNFYYR